MRFTFLICIEGAISHFVFFFTTSSCLLTPITRPGEIRKREEMESK